MFCYVGIPKGTISSSPFLAEESSASSGIYSTGVNQQSLSSATSSVFSTHAIISNGEVAASATNTKQTNSIRRGPGRPRKPPVNQQLPRKSRVVKRTRGGGNSGPYHQLQQCHHPLSTPIAAGQSPLMQTQDNTNSSFMSNMMLPSPIHEDGSCPFDNDSANSTPNNSTSATGSIVSSSGNGILSATVSSSNAVAATNDDTSEADSKSAAWIRDIVLGPDKPSSEKSSEKVSGGTKVMLPPEELPYFPEKWPGKVCALCCLGERSQLGQGEMLRIEFKNGDPKSIAASAATSSSSGAGSEFSQISQEDEKSPRGNSSQQSTQLSNRRQKGLNKCK